MGKVGGGGGGGKKKKERNRRQRIQQQFKQTVPCRAELGSGGLGEGELDGSCRRLGGGWREVALRVGWSGSLEGRGFDDG